MDTSNGLHDSSIPVTKVNFKGGSVHVTLASGNTNITTVKYYLERVTDGTYDVDSAEIYIDDVFQDTDNISLPINVVQENPGIDGINHDQSRQNQAKPVTYGKANTDDEDLRHIALTLLGGSILVIAAIIAMWEISPFLPVITGGLSMLSGIYLSRHVSGRTYTPRHARKHAKTHDHE